MAGYTLFSRLKLIIFFLRQFFHFFSYLPKCFSNSFRHKKVSWLYLTPDHTKGITLVFPLPHSPQFPVPSSLVFSPQSFRHWFYLRVFQLKVTDLIEGKKNALTHTTDKSKDFKSDWIQRFSKYHQVPGMLTHLFSLSLFFPHTPPQSQPPIPTPRRPLHSGPALTDVLSVQGR